jgi:hypothetical protein
VLYALQKAHCVLLNFDEVFQRELKEISMIKEPGLVAHNINLIQE